MLLRGEQGTEAFFAFSFLLGDARVLICDRLFLFGRVCPSGGRRGRGRFVSIGACVCIFCFFLFVLLLVVEEGIEGGGGGGGEGGSGRRGGERGDVYGVVVAFVMSMCVCSVEARRFAFSFLLVVVCVDFRRKEVWRRLSIKVSVCVYVIYSIEIKGSLCSQTCKHACHVNGLGGLGKAERDRYPSGHRDTTDNFIHTYYTFAFISMLLSSAGVVGKDTEVKSRG